MNRAYDHVDWSVLNRILCSVGFSTRAVGLIDQHFAVDSMYLLLNGRSVEDSEWKDVLGKEIFYLYFVHLL